MNKPITPEQMDQWVNEIRDRCQDETDEERVLWEKQEAAFEKIKNNPELLQTLIRMKDR